MQMVRTASRFRLPGSADPPFKRMSGKAHAHASAAHRRAPHLFVACVHSHPGRFRLRGDRFCSEGLCCQTSEQPAAAGRGLAPPTGSEVAPRSAEPPAAGCRTAWGSDCWDRAVPGTQSSRSWSRDSAPYRPEGFPVQSIKHLLFFYIKLFSIHTFLADAQRLPGGTGAGLGSGSGSGSGQAHRNEKQLYCVIVFAASHHQGRMRPSGSVWNQPEPPHRCPPPHLLTHSRVKTCGLKKTSAGRREGADGK